MDSESVLQVIKSRILKVLVPLALWLILGIGAGVAAALYIQDSVIVEYIGVGTAFLLILWWVFISWWIKSEWLLDIQNYMLENQILPFNFVKFKRCLPWTAGMQKEKLIRSVAGEYYNLREKAARTQQTLEKYVGTNITAKAADKANRSELGGELQRVYVLFSDLRGFTHMAEQLKPEETVDILNKIFSAMEEVITQNGGNINKFIGDAIFAYFRRPYSNEGEATKPVLRAALRMQDRFEILNKGFKAAYSDQMEIGMGIGVAAGTAIVGNLGSANRMEFTLIGDTINLASRLCGIAKSGQILVNEEMAEVSQDYFELTALPAVQIKGKSGIHTPYQVLGERLTMSR